MLARFPDKSSRLALLLCGVTFCAFAIPTSAWSDEAEQRPWAQGVSAEDRKKGIAFFNVGNILLEDKQWSAAMTQYMQGLVYWDHPGIHYNLMQALVKLGRTLEAYHAAEAALRFEGEALESDEKKDAMATMKELREQLAEIEVSCAQEGVSVTLNGKAFFTGRGVKTTLVLPGVYQLEAKKTGYFTYTEAIKLKPQESRHIEIRLLRNAPSEDTFRRWAVWKPWAVVGGGAGLALIGAGLQVSGSGNAERAGELLALHCPSGCRPEDYPDELSVAVGRSESMPKVAMAMYSLAGAAVIAGGVMTWLNRARPGHNGTRAARSERKRLILTGLVGERAGQVVLVGSF